MESADVDPLNERKGDGPNVVQSLRRGLDVLNSFGSDARELTIAEVARRIGSTRAAARRSLWTLEELGYVRHLNGRFALRPKVLDLAEAFLSSTGFDTTARPHLETLVSRTLQSSSLCTLDFPDVVYTVRVPAYRVEPYGPLLGGRMPAFASSMGRVLLADMPPDSLRELMEDIPMPSYTPRTITELPLLMRELDRVREQGWALVDQEFAQGVRSIAAPVLGHDGRVIAAVNVTTNAAVVSAERLLGEHLPLLLEATHAITSEMSGVTYESVRPSSR